MLQRWFSRKLLVLLCVGLSNSLLPCSPAYGRELRSNVRGQVPDLQKGFVTPPDRVKVSAFYYWLNNHISKEGVVRDLHAMKEAGITRVFIGSDIRHRTDWSRDITGKYFGKVKVFSDEWWDVLHTALKTASELNIEVGLFNCPGWSQSGGPWIRPQQAMRYLDASETRVKGPAQVTRLLATTDTLFQDVKVLAMRVPEHYQQNLLDLPGTRLKSQKMEIVSPPSGQAQYRFSGGEAVLDIELPEEETVRSLTLFPGDHAAATVDVQVKIESGYRSVQKAEFSRAIHVENLAEGFEPHAPFLLSVAAVKGKNFRLVFTNKGSKTSELRRIVLSPTPVIANLAEKKLAKITDSSPSWTASQNRTEPHTPADVALPDTGDVLDISRYMSPDGTLNWDAPEGDWIIMRTGMRFIDVRNGPASFEAEGLEVDKMNKEAVKFHFNAFIGQILKRIPAADRKTFTMVIMDSYERGGSNFTDRFLEDFQKRYGYDPTPYLPAYRGHLIGSAATTDRFLWDVRRLVADRVAENYVGGMREASHEHGLRTWLENYGNSPAEFLQYGGQSDEVGGEFWVGSLGSRSYRFLLRAAASAAHIYGKNRVWAESFTSGSWTRNLGYSTYPQELKSLGDWAFAQGVNSTVLHLYIQQPYEDVYPGIDAWFGTEFNRKNTWFKHVDLLTLYHRRSNFMLQQGRNVADIAYYIGEDNPLTREPQWIEFRKGFNYDYINAEVIVRDLRVKDGRFFLPDGATYRVLALPPRETMRPEVLRKIERLVSAGGVVVGNPPSRSPSLQDYPHADHVIQQLARQLWGDGSERQRQYGKGMVFNHVSLSEVLQTLALAPDLHTENESIEYTHRTLNGKEVYFLANTTGKPVQFTAAFRVRGLQPELWDALSGTTRSLPAFEQGATTVTVPLKLSANGSAFIVFRQKGTPSARDVSANFPEPTTVSAVNGPWQVSFEHDPIRRGPDKPIVLNELKDWTRLEDERVRHYSGPAVYTTSFAVGRISQNKNYYLDLGELTATAKVKVNGKYVGGVWTYPYRVNVSGAVRPGNNTLEVEVINTWRNRLVGDHQLPEQERVVQSRINPWNGDSSLQKSGLLGPVALFESRAH
jgi:hypothetical protein